MRKFNTFHLKLIAVLFMLCDHIAYACISPTSIMYIPMRCIGRLAAPIFWFCFVEGYRHTSNKKQYFKRLFWASLLMACANMVFVFLFYMMGYSISWTPMQPNIFLTMLLMMIVIYCLEKGMSEKNKPKFYAFVFTSILVMFIVGRFAEYSWFAVFSILCLYFIHNKIIQYNLFAAGNVILAFLMKNPYQACMIFAIIFFLLYTDEKPKQSLKYFFYFFYPLHLWILVLIGQFII